MFSRRSKKPEIDKEQQLFFEHARKRVIQKKRLFVHLVLFLIGALFLIVINGVLGIGSTIQFLGVDWFVFAILLWAFIFIFHAVKVWILHPFMGSAWEEKQWDALVVKQKKRIARLQEQVEREHPIPTTSSTEVPEQLPGNEDEIPPLL